MGFLEDAMDNYRPPAAEDLEIVLPARREPKKEAAEAAGEPRDLGQHGGAADGSQGPADAVAGSTAPEPVPQRDDPDDGEHTDSTEDAVSARAAAAAAAQPVEDEPAEPADTTDVPSAEDVEEAEVEEFDPEPTVEAKPLTVKQKLAKIKGSVPRTFQKTGFSAGGVDMLTVKPFPQALVDGLRLSLAPAVGGEFAEALSAPALITAFLMAKTGVELDVDSNTAAAVDVFRQVDPRLLAVEDKLDETMKDVSKLARAMDLSLHRISEAANITDGLEFAMAYLIADRVAGLTTTDTDETTVDVAQKKVLVARESIRKRAKAQRTIERHRDGRRMS